LTTVWSAIGSECDNVVGGLLNPNQYANAIDINANFALVYASGSDTCYDHGGAIHDNNTKLDAKYYYCNTSETGGSPCGLDYNAKNREWKETAKGLRGLPLMYYLISGLDIEQAGESSNKALLIGLTTAGGVTAVAVGAGIIAKIMKGENGCGGHGDGHDGGDPQASTSGTAHIELAQQPEAQEVVADEHGDGHGDSDAAAQNAQAENLGEQAKDVTTQLSDSPEGEPLTDNTSDSAGRLTDASSISKTTAKHLLNRHSFSRVQIQLKYQLNKISRADIEADLADRTFFNKTWTEEQCLQAAEIAFRHAKDSNVVSGKFIYNVFGENVAVVLENGILQTSWGPHKYTLADFGF
jgi:hypothetical protein